MNPIWKALLEQYHGQIADDGAVSFGDLSSELSAARSATVLVPLTHVGLIRATGVDAGDFLHNLMTNDVKHLVPHLAQHNSLCNAKGRMLASFLIWREGSDYLLQLSRDLQPAILKKLGMYILRSKVKLSDAGDDYALMGIAGTGVDAALESLGVDLKPALRTAPFSDGTAIRLDGQRCQIAVRTEAAGQVWQRLAAMARPAGTEVWRWLDISAGIPQITTRTQEEFVPQMANFELIGGVSFHKGCYPGQEIVARTQYLGKLKRRMYLAHLAQDTAAEAGAHLYSADMEDQSCGMVVNSALAPGGGHDLLAVIQMSSADGQDVHVGSLNGPQLEFRALPYALG